MTSTEKQSQTKRITPHWYSFSVDEVFEKIKSDSNGLGSAEANRRLEIYGPNRLQQIKRRSNWSLLIAQFKNVLIYVLLAATVVTTLIGHYVDAAVIFGVVLLNAIIGFLQEGKAEKALDAIRDLLSPKATVLRDRKPVTINAENLVPGDVVILEAGDKVPSDIRLFKTKNLQIDESSLTGESVPVEKSTDKIKKYAPLGDRKSVAFSGTLVTSGQGRGVVVATGSSTELGRISSLIAMAPPVTTRLLLKIAEFSRWLTITIGIIAVITLTFGILFRGYNLTEMFLAAVGLAVAAIPEGLPAILTITLAIGVQRMASRKAIIRRLPSVETLGSVTIICSDKTGTLTRNEMTVRSVAVASEQFEVSGQGYEPQGTFTSSDQEFACHLISGEQTQCSKYPDLMELARAGLLCNDSYLNKNDDIWQVQGDPTEGALLVLAAKTGLDSQKELENLPRSDSIPFESEHRYMATLHHSRDRDKSIIYVKGAPERILDICSYQLNGQEISNLDRSFWQRRIQQIARQGQRTLALAYKEVNLNQNTLSKEDVEKDLILLGTVGLIDPPRGDAINSIEQCRNAGIRVCMITGDHALTALAVGAQMGIGDGATALSGEEIDNLSDTRLQDLIKQVDVFARVSPEHKLRLVQALQSIGEVVAMTGDGVNDAPALKRADVGVSMGRKGTEAAKEASEMVLADDNFASIAHAVEEGRTVYDNIKKSITFILPTNGGEAGLIMVAIFFGFILPITPVQILWVNMITAVTLALTLAFEPSEGAVMKRPPRDPKEPLLTKYLIWRIGFVSLILVLGTFGLFVLERTNGASVQMARTVAVNTLVIFEIFYLFNIRFLLDFSLTRQGIFGNSFALAAVFAVVIFQMLFTYFPPLQGLFDTVALTPATWVYIILVASSVLVLVELEKFIVRSFISGPRSSALSKTTQSNKIDIANHIKNFFKTISS